MWPQDPQFPRALAGGVTTIQVLPGLGEPDRRPQRGAQGRALAHRAGDEVPRREVRPQDGVRREPEARVRGARPVDAHGQRRRLSRARGSSAEAYRRRWDKWLTATGRAIRRRATSAIETLAEVLRGNIFVHNHCYRADEMAQMIDIAKEFGYAIRSFHHGVEAYKVADLLARERHLRRRCGPTGAASRWRRSTACAATCALVHEAGARAIVHSDDAVGHRSG